MSNVLQFTPRPRPTKPEVLAPLAGLALRAHLEDAAQTALDAADKIIAALDHIEGADDEQTGRPIHLREPAPPVPTPAPKPQAPPEPPPEIQPEPLLVAMPEPCPEPIRLPWRGTGNVVSAAGCAILALVARG